MTIFELNEDQKRQLKTDLYCQENHSVSWGELANIDELVSDEQLYETFGSVDFVEDDFSVMR